MYHSPRNRADDLSEKTGKMSKVGLSNMREDISGPLGGTRFGYRPRHGDAGSVHAKFATRQSRLVLKAVRYKTWGCPLRTRSEEPLPDRRGSDGGGTAS